MKWKILSYLRASSFADSINFEHFQSEVNSKEFEDMKLLSVVLICTILSACHGYRILGVFPFNGKSHFMMFEHLMKALARKGHQVDVISTFPLKKPYPNYNDMIVLPAARQFMNNMTYDEINTLFRDSVISAVADLAGNLVCEHLNDPQIQELIQNPPKDPPYDAIIMEVWITVKENLYNSFWILSCHWNW